MLEYSHISDFLPINPGDDTVSKYLLYNYEKLESSIKNNIETAAFLHTHILYMTFIYFQILRISKYKHQEFKYSRIGLSSNEKDFLKDTLNPFSFSKINEKTVFRFFRLLDFDDGIIGNISSCVNDRNKLLHATGTNMNNLLSMPDYPNNMGVIIRKSKSFLCELYENFKNDNPGLLEEGYEIQYYDIEMNFLTPYYISLFEVNCLLEWLPEDKIIKAMKDNF